MPRAPSVHVAAACHPKSVGFNPTSPAQGSGCPGLAEAFLGVGRGQDPLPEGQQCRSPPRLCWEANAPLRLLGSGNCLWEQRAQQVCWQVPLVLPKSAVFRAICLWGLLLPAAMLLGQWLFPHKNKRREHSHGRSET